MSRIKDLIKSVVADGKVSAAEWKDVLEPAAGSSHRANARARELLALYFDSRFEMAPEVRADLRATLEQMGYPIPAAVPPAGLDLEALVEANISEPDRDFARLLRLAGGPRERVRVAVLDAGFQVDHDALGGKLLLNSGEVPGNGADDDHNGYVDDACGWDFVEERPQIDGDSHGSHVIGLATRGTGVVKALPLRVVGDAFDPFQVREAIEYAARAGARVINMSLSVMDPGDVRILKEAMRRHPEILFCKSAGNDGNCLDGVGDYAPENNLACNVLPNMVVVAAADADGRKAEYSNFGLPYATVATIGTEVLSSVPTDKFRRMSGTSMATPEISGLAGRCLALAPRLTPSDLKQILVETSDGRDDWGTLVVAGGLVNARRALRLAALVGLVHHEGLAPGSAADRLHLEGAERERLLALVPHYPVPVPTESFVAGELTPRPPDFRPSGRSGLD